MCTCGSGRRAILTLCEEGEGKPSCVLTQNAHACYSSAMVPTAANSPSRAQPAIVKIRRVKDALIIPLLFVPLLLLLLVFTRLPRSFYSLMARINIPPARRPRAAAAAGAAAAPAARSPCRRYAFAFAFTLVQIFEPARE